MSRYFVAMRSGHRSTGQSVLERLRSFPGLVIKGSTNPDRVLIETSPEVAERLRHSLGDHVIIEGEVHFKTLHRTGTYY